METKWPALAVKIVSKYKIVFDFFNYHILVCFNTSAKYQNYRTITTYIIKIQNNFQFLWVYTKSK